MPPAAFGTAAELRLPRPLPQSPEGASRVPSASGDGWPVLRDMLTQFDVPENELPPEAENWTEEMILTRDDVWQYRNEPVIPKLKEAVKVIWGA